jgi:hypothetical protein
MSASESTRDGGPAGARDTAPRGLEDLSNLPLPLPPPPSALLEAELAQLAPIRTRRPMRQLALLVGISLIYGGGVFAMFATRRDFHELPMGWLLGISALWLLGFVAPVYLAMVPRPGAVIPRWRLAGIASVLGAIGFIALGLAVHPSSASSAAPALDQLAHGYSCFEVGLVTAIVPVVVGAIFLRGALPVGSRGVAAALGAGGGSMGGLMLHLHCSVSDGIHVGLLHGGVVGIAALLAAALVPRATKIR